MPPAIIFMQRPWGPLIPWMRILYSLFRHCIGIIHIYVGICSKLCTRVMCVCVVYVFYVCANVQLTGSDEWFYHFIFVAQSI